jgi:hypothetical protein
MFETPLWCLREQQYSQTVQGDVAGTGGVGGDVHDMAWLEEAIASQEGKFEEGLSSG